MVIVRKTISTEFRTCVHSVHTEYRQCLVRSQTMNLRLDKYVNNFWKDSKLMLNFCILYA